MSYKCKKCNYVAGSRRQIRKHVRANHKIDSNSEVYADFYKRVDDDE